MESDLAGIAGQVADFEFLAAQPADAGNQRCNRPGDRRQAQQR